MLEPSPLGTPLPVAARYKAWIYGRSLPGIAGSIPAGGLDGCVLSGRCLCDVLITSTEESLKVAGSIPAGVTGIFH